MATVLSTISPSCIAKYLLLAASRAKRCNLTCLNTALLSFAHASCNVPLSCVSLASGNSAPSSHGGHESASEEERGERTGARRRRR
ncbi:hypothetical protein FPQ18DRAFT_354489 [Pyronema domesticum]|nr:hypothetical protein FPQ18DRAFT_354489 [Pyronema domesticum]